MLNIRNLVFEENPRRNLMVLKLKLYRKLIKKCIEFDNLSNGMSEYYAVWSEKRIQFYLKLII